MKLTNEESIYITADLLHEIEINWTDTMMHIAMIIYAAFYLGWAMKLCLENAEMVNNTGNWSISMKDATQKHLLSNELGSNRGCSRCKCCSLSDIEEESECYTDESGQDEEENGQEEKESEQEKKESEQEKKKKEKKGEKGGDQMGELHLIVGPMYAGKSTELLRHIRTHQFLNRRMVVINHAWNMRYNTKGVSTHTGERYTNCIHATLLQQCEHRSAFHTAEYVFIEELQFFGDAVQVLNRWVNQLRKHVYAAALSGDYLCNGFDTITPLYSMADRIEHISAYCACCRDGTLAPFTYKIKTPSHNVGVGAGVGAGGDENVNENDKDDTSTTSSVVEVGGENKYMAVCRKHYLMLQCSASATHE